MIEYVYGLVCPISGEVKYVGKSKSPKKRYNQHIKKLDKQLTPKRKWLESLLEKSLMPKMIIFEESNVFDSRDIEQFYCDKHKKTILNIHNPAKGMKSIKWK